MGRSYELKVKIYADLTIEKAIEEVARGAKLLELRRNIIWWHHYLEGELGKIKAW